MQHTDRQYGWLFPVIAPFLIVAVVMITISAPLIAHWQAISRIEHIGGSVAFSSGRAAWGMIVPDSMLTTVDAIALRGPHIDDAILGTLAAIRGRFTLTLEQTRVSDDAIRDFKRQRPDIHVRRAG